MCQKAATAAREIKRRLRRENRGVSSCCLHLAVRILKELRFRLISWWAFHSASFRLPLEIALRWKVLEEKKGTLLCLTLLIWEHIETGNVILAQLFTTKQAEDCQILEGEEWHIEKTVTKQPSIWVIMGMFTYLQCHSNAVPRTHWFLADASGAQYSPTNNLQISFFPPLKDLFVFQHHNCPFP